MSCFVVQCDKSLLSIVKGPCTSTIEMKEGCAAAVPGEIAPKHLDPELHVFPSEKKYAHGTAFSTGMNGDAITSGSFTCVSEPLIPTGNDHIYLPFSLCGYV